MLRKIDCVMLRVDELDTAVAYYRDVLGLRPRWRQERSVGLGMPETDAEIVLHTESDLPREPTVHYLVDDVVATVARLAASGCTIVAAPFDITIGKCAVLTDLGNTLHILDMTKGPLPDRLGLSDEE